MGYQIQAQPFGTKAPATYTYDDTRIVGIERRNRSIKRPISIYDASHIVDTKHHPTLANKGEAAYPQCPSPNRPYHYNRNNKQSPAYAYGPFGELIRATGSKKDEFNFRFSTKYQDAETGLLYYGFRYYDADQGRWLNRDPIGERGGLNLYGFVDNDSLNYWDYLGREKAGGSYVVVNTDSSGNNPLHNNATGRYESRQNLINQVNGSDGPGKGFDVNTGPKVPNAGVAIGKSAASSLTGIPLSPEDIATLPFDIWLQKGGSAGALAMKKIGLCRKLQLEYQMSPKKSWKTSTYNVDSFSIGYGSAGDYGEKGEHSVAVVKEKDGCYCSITAWHEREYRSAWTLWLSKKTETVYDLQIGDCRVNCSGNQYHEEP